MADQLNVTNFSVAPPGSFPATVERKTDPAGGVTPTFVQWGQIGGNILQQIDLQQQFVLKAGLAELNAHIADHANPHQVTKAQVGLGNVENLSPAELATAIAPTIGPLISIAAAQISDSTVPGRAVLMAATAAAQRTALGANTFGDQIFTGATANGASIATSSTAAGVPVATAATAAAQRTALGSGVTGDAIFTSASVDAARSTMGLGGMLTFRNPVQNAGLGVNQRNNQGTSITADGSYLSDGWKLANGATNRITGSNTIGSLAAGPTRGSPNFINLVVNATGAVGAAEVYGTVAPVESQLVQPWMRYGTAQAASSVATFDAKSSVLGTYCLAIRNGATNRSYLAPFTINAANTWETKTIVIPGDTAGAWANDNTAIFYSFTVAAGATFSSATTNAWQAGNFTGITGQTQLTSSAVSSNFSVGNFQIDQGVVASPFELLPYDMALLRAQRYLPGFISYSTAQEDVTGWGSTQTTTVALLTFEHRVPTRIPPTSVALITGTTIGMFGMTTISAAGALTGLVLSTGSRYRTRMSATGPAVYTPSQPCVMYSSGTANAGIVMLGAEF